MADLEKTVAIIFEGVDRMGSGVTSATRQLDEFSGKAQAIASPLATVTAGILAAEGAAGALAITLGKQAYDAAVKFEAAQADLAKTLGENDGSVDEYTRQITELSNTYGESATDLLASMANYKQAGFTAEESLQLVKNGLDLVIAGDVEAQRASEILVASLKGFKVPASEAAELLEVLNASSNTYATDVDQLAAGMARLSPIASSMGLGFAETAELLIPVIEVFRSGPEAANALRTGLLRLGDDSKPVTDALASIGVAQRGTNGTLRDSSDILNDVAKATGGLEEAQKLFVAQQLFGIEQAPKMVEVLTAIESSSIDVNKALQESTSVMDEVNTRLETAEKVGDRTREAYENLARTMGLQFKTEMAGIVDAIGEVFRQFESAAAAGAMDDFWNAITPTLEEIRRLALEVAEALPTALAEADYSGFADGMEALFGGLEDVEITSDDVRRAIEGLGDSFRALAQFTDGTFEVFKGFVGVIKPVVEAFTNLDGETQKWIGVVGGISLAVGPAATAITTLSGAVAALAGKGGVLAIATGTTGRLAKALSGTGKLGMVGAAGAAAIALSELYQELQEFNDFRFNFSEEMERELDKTTGAQRLATEFSLYATEKIAEAYNGLSGAFGWGDDAADEIDAVSSVAVDAAKAVAGLSGSAEGAEDTLGDLGTAAGTAASGVARISQEAIDAARSVANLDSGERAVEDLDAAAVEAAISVAKIGENANAINVLSANLEDTSKFVRGVDGDLIEVNKTISIMGGTVEQASQQIEDGTEKFGEMEKAAMRLASNERIKAMEFTAEINVAEIEAGARKVEAALGSINKGIDSTGGTLSDLFRQLGDPDLSRSDQIGVESAIRKEQTRRDQEFQLQQDLIKQQIQLARAKTNAIRNGEGLVKIDSTGLEPALEMVMWQILEKIQLQANAEGAEFLLGLGNGGA